MMFQPKLLKFDAPLSTEEVMIAMSHHIGWWNRKQLAETLGCAKSPSLVKVLNQAITDGLLYWSTIKMPNGVDMWIYMDRTHELDTGEVSDDSGRVTFLPF